VQLLLSTNQGTGILSFDRSISTETEFSLVTNKTARFEEKGWLYIIRQRFTLIIFVLSTFQEKEHTKQLAFGYIMSHIKKPHSEQERFLSVIRRKIAENTKQPLYENVAGAELLQLDYRVQRISRFGL
jgi:hypothetical protein